MSFWTKIARPVVKTVARGVAAYFTGGASELAFAALQQGQGPGPDPAAEQPFTEPPLKVRMAQYALRAAASLPVVGMVAGPLSDEFDRAQAAADQGDQDVADMLAVDQADYDENYDEDYQ